ncbi:leucine-rich repeat-containing protein kinase family protein [Roseateles violae]|uniref:Leucine-rich repeat-containing protein kinase family protein n=1 Tax=Roseateles violae TaxID=3058042 RepID=A0ABT8DYZ4_9BURK|nr:leucine-rich repeat-containing protein kinase family protein [Pelomonas sp. PFR6]MDN3922783.1 leucine-rich repeat-containing protein kinase family protein [Pelomonas sp. PFR6]
MHDDLRPHTLELLRSGALAGSRRLNLVGLGLREFPPEILELADTLEILDLSGNALDALPEELPRLRKLRILFCSGNRFGALPAVLGRCEQLEMVGFKSNRIAELPAEALPPRLRWLILTDNAIETLPAAIGRCVRLQKLALAGNRLRELPPQLADCHRLELLRISANRLEQLPDWLLELPRLSWLAFGGNPCSEAREQAALAQSTLADLPWSALRIEARLGEGASGVIHRAMRSDGTEGAVAVKVFKGAVTSDGWPGSELAASIHAGAHANLIPLRGRLSGHPAQAQGLVMALVGPEFRSLAGPPSLASCSRDVYAEGTRFELAALLRLAGGIASAVQQLHRRGIMHGDLYGHNILHCGQGRALLGDFGAASFFDPAAAAQAAAVQRIEARAFGCLLEELIERCTPATAHEAAVIEALAALRDACLDERPGRRPLFDAIMHSLAAHG